MKFKFDSEWTPVIMIGIFIAFLFVMADVAMGATWPIYAHIPATVDSVWFVKYTNGTATDSTKYTKRYIDTTITTVATSDYMVALQIYYAGEDSSTTWAWVRPATIPAGSGTDTVVIYAVDTSGTDTLLSDVKITVKNTGGTVVSVQTTGSAGKSVFYLDTATYTVIGKQAPSAPTMHLFNSASLVVSGNQDSTEFQGYDMSIAAPTGSNGCTVYGYVYGPNNAAVKNAEVFFELPEGFNDTCGNTIIGKFTEKTRTDSVGYFSQELFKSKCLENGTYTIRVRMKDGSMGKNRQFTVPDSTSYKLVW